MYKTTPMTTPPKISHRTTAVSSDVGDPFVLISANPPPITRAAKASTKNNSDALRAPLHEKRPCARSGGPDPFFVGSRSAATAHRLHSEKPLISVLATHGPEVYIKC